MSWNRRTILILAAGIALAVAGPLIFLRPNGLTVTVPTPRPNAHVATPVALPASVPESFDMIELTAHEAAFNDAMARAAVADGYARIVWEEVLRGGAERDAFAASFPPPVVRQAPVSASGGCGYGSVPARLPDQIPSSIVTGESNHTLDAQNCTSSASGKYQFLDSTWGGYGGYAHAKDAPESVQDERAAQVWNGGAGCGNWRCG